MVKYSILIAWSAGNPSPYPGSRPTNVRRVTMPPIGTDRFSRVTAGIDQSESPAPSPVCASNAARRHGRTPVISMLSEKLSSVRTRTSIPRAVTFSRVVLDGDRLDDVGSDENLEPQDQRLPEMTSDVQVDGPVIAPIGECSNGGPHRTENEDQDADDLEPSRDRFHGIGEFHGGTLPRASSRNGIVMAALTTLKPNPGSMT